MHGRLERQFVTAGYLYVDRQQKRMWYAGAAHPPLLVWRRASRLSEEIVENGLMLGPFAHAGYDSVCIVLEPGDRVLMVTDGVLEAADSNGEQFGMERLKPFLEENNALSPHVFADALIKRLATWSGTGNSKRQEDDITLLVMDVTGGIEDDRGERLKS